MLKLLFAPLLLSLAIRPARASEILFYTGDPDGNTAFGDFINGPPRKPMTVSEIFQPFTVNTGSPWEINSLFINAIDLGAFFTGQAQWSIRTGMGPFDPGRLIAEGVAPATLGGENDDTISVSGLDILLKPGDYWVDLTPIDSSGKFLIESTSGANSVNVMLDGGGLWYEPGLQFYSPTGLDFSVGATGVVIPEPGTLPLLCAGCALILLGRQALCRRSR